MSSIGIKTEADRERAIRLINNRAFPFSITLKKGIPRSISQNKLQRKWLLEAQEQGDQTAEEYRGYCKLWFGVPMLRNEDEEFRKIYDKIIRPLPHPMKLEMMMVPLDLGITRRMTTKQKTKYLDQMYLFFTAQGFELTQPELR